MSKEEILYTDDTKLKDLTVGQLKDIIVETFSHSVFNTIDNSRRYYNYTPGYTVDTYTKPRNPYEGPYCQADLTEE